MIKNILTFCFLCTVASVITVKDISAQDKPQSRDRLNLTGEELRLRKIGNKNVREFVGNVKAWQGEAYMQCNRGIHYPDEAKLDLIENVEFFNNGKWLYADKVIYYEEPQIEIAEGNVRLLDSTKILLAQRLKYFEKEDKAFADDSVHILDDKNRLTLVGNHAEYHRLDGYAKVTGSPILSKKDSTNKIELTISGIEMEMFEDGIR